MFDTNDRRVSSYSLRRPPHMFSVCDTHCRSEWLYGRTPVPMGYLQAAAPAAVQHERHVLLSKLSASSSPVSPTVWHAKKRGDQCHVHLTPTHTHTRPKEEEEEENQSASCCVPCLHV